MYDIMEIYDEYKNIGIKTRKITQGLEFDMVKDFIQFKKNKFKPSSTNNLMIFVEPQINNSYPDIVFVQYNPNSFDTWSKSRLKLTKIDYKICYHIYVSKRIDATQIVLQLGVTWKEAFLSIERLYDAGLIIRKRNKWSIIDNTVFSVKRIEAVEAKINNLDSVFKQALVNKTFASESYVLSNINKNIDQKKLDKYGEFGIGLYSQIENNFNLLKKPSKSDFPVSFNSIYFNEWIGKILLTKSGGHNC
ncbi:hypothetical protein [Paenibacillus chitinolyticus]|uniref:hypothetical protein n=1 Tax=Paenibacillus chitinolyticus TaxID=79263 RepID=UPI003668F3EF